MAEVDTQKGIDKFYNERGFEIEARIAHIAGENFDIDNQLKVLYFLEEVKIPFLIEVPRCKIEATATDIIININRKEIIKLCSFFKANGWNLDCIHFSRFPLKYSKKDGLTIIEGRSVETVYDDTYLKPAVFLTFQDMVGLLIFFDICERAFNMDD